MKVIHFLLGKADPNTMNGVNKVVHHLATEQIKLNLDVEVWGITKTPDFISHKHNYPLLLFPASKFRFILSKKIKDSIKCLSSKTIAHLHSVFIPELFMISRLLHKKKIPWVFTAYGGYSKKCWKRNRFLKIIFIKLFESHVLKHAKMLHAIGQSEIADFNYICKNQRIVVLPNGQDLNFLNGLINPVSPESNLIFGYCGRLDALHKGLDLLLEGFSTFISKGGSAELWLIGDGKDRIFLENYAKSLCIADKVKFLGPLYGDEKIEKIRLFDVFVHTSRWDAAPTALLEAAALSKPLLISEETNIGNFVERYSSGIVLQKNSPIHIASAMRGFDRKYLTNTILKIGKSANLMIKREFEWTYIANRMINEVYELDQYLKE
jgi:glycosyltransferase involved in cell wall biosynthesis